MDRDAATILDIVLSRAQTGGASSRHGPATISTTTSNYSTPSCTRSRSSARPRTGSPRRFRQTHPDIPWGDIIGTRNRIIHGYDQVKLDAIWSIATEKIAPVLAELEPLLPTPPETEA